MPRRKKAQEASRGLAAAELAAGSPSAPATQLREQIERDGGTVLAVFRDPLGSHWQLFAAHHRARAVEKRTLAGLTDRTSSDLSS